MAISIKKMVNDYFEGNRAAAANAAGLNSVQQLNNMISAGRQVAQLADGNWIVLTSKSKIFQLLTDNQ